MGTSSVTGLETIIFADNASFDGTERAGAMSQDGELWIGSTASPHVKKGTITSPDSSISVGYSDPDITLEANGSVLLQTLTPDQDFDGSAATPISPQSGNINVFGSTLAAATVTETYNSTGAATGNLEIEHRAWTTPFVVDASTTPGARGTFSTIQAAINAAVSGQTIFIRPSATPYTEDLTLKAGVNLTAYIGDERTPNVSIVGKLTMTAAGTVNITGIRLTTNNDYFLEVTGSNAVSVVLRNCYLNCLNNTGINCNNANASLSINSCNGNIATTGITLFSIPSVSQSNFFYCNFINSGNSTTLSTVANGQVGMFYCRTETPMQSTSTGFFSLRYTQISINSLNTTCITNNGTGTTSDIDKCLFSSGTASAISIGAGSTCNVNDTFIGSSNANGVTGAGTLVYTNLQFPSTSNADINTTTQTPTYASLGKYRANGQPSFLATNTVQRDNVTGTGTVYRVPVNNIVFDQGNNFDGATGTFTAPVTGKYCFMIQCFIVGCTVAAGITVRLVTSNRTLSMTFNRAASNSSFGEVVNVVTDMDAGDTANMDVLTTGEAADTNDVANVNTRMSGFLQA